MPASLAEQIAQRAEAIAQALPAIAASTYRDRQDAFSREETPALIIEHVDEDTTAVGGPVGPFTPVGALESNDVRIAFVVCTRGAAWQAAADAVRVARLSRRLVKQNLAWSAGYNLLAIPLAAGVLAPIGFVLPMGVGAILMSASTVVVALNAQLLRRLDLSPQASTRAVWARAA